jgi:hypothetical protein
LNAQEPVVVVDMAGSAPILSELHHHYGENMKHSCRIGATRYHEMGATDNLPGATPEFFFAPGHIQSRSAELGAEKLMMSLGTGFVDFRAASAKWLGIDYSDGATDLESTYQLVLAGSADPARGHIVSMWET